MPHTRRIVIIEEFGDELRDLREAIERVAEVDTQVSIVRKPESVYDLLRRNETLDLIIVDYERGPDGHCGLDTLETIRHINPDVPVVVVAEKGDVASASEAIDRGATDFLVRAGSLEERVSTELKKIKSILRLIEKNRKLSSKVDELRQAEAARYRIVGQSPKLIELLDRVERIAEIPRPVLIIGERGTGKELVARAIHEAGGGERPFCVVNCAAIADTLIDSELFGHEKGAFTGAAGKRQGIFEQADGGTLFLDEIGHMSHPFQQKILRVVEYGTFTRVGGTQEVRVDTRIIAATNIDLKGRIETGDFMGDLYDRLSFEVLKIPPLRERPEDVEYLSEYFLEEFMREIPAFRGKSLSDEALNALRNYSFPGNVRELKNIIERAVYRDTDQEIEPEDIGLDGNEPTPDFTSGGFKDRVEAFERRLITDALDRANGNQAEAARILDLSYHQFRYHLKKYDDEAVKDS